MAYIAVTCKQLYQAYQCVCYTACREIDFQEEGFTINLKDIHKFVDEYEVELVARCCRWGHNMRLVNAAAR